MTVAAEQDKLDNVKVEECNLEQNKVENDKVEECNLEQNKIENDKLEQDKADVTSLEVIKLVTQEHNRLLCAIKHEDLSIVVEQEKFFYGPLLEK